MTNTKELDDRIEEVAEKVKELGRNGAAEYFGVNPSTFRDFLYRRGLPTTKEKTEKNESTLKLRKENVEIETAKQTDPFEDNDSIIKQRNLDPKEYEIEGLVDSEWDSPNGETLRSRKLTLKRKNNIKGRLVLPARVDGKSWERPKSIPKDKKFTALVVGDQQAPFHDPYFEEKQLMLLEDQKFEKVINIGDTNDFPDISRYKRNPELEAIASVQDCVNAGYWRLRNQREANPDAEIIKLIGNHDVRLRDFQLNYVPQIFGLKRAEVEGIEESPVMSIENLLRLDELKVDLVGDNANYEHGQYNISNHVATRHGWYANKGSGKSALNTLEHLGYSIIVGHTHRQAIVHKTTFDIHGESSVLCAVEIGASCLLDVTGLGFAPAPDWQQGGCTVTVYPDGRFHVDLLTYVNGDLYWRDQRY